MNGWMLPGRMISSAGAARCGCTTETDGTASCAVIVRSRDSCRIRKRIPKTTMPVTNVTMTVVFSHAPRVSVIFSPPLVEYAEEGRHEQQRRDGREQQAADDGSSK